MSFDRAKRRAWCLLLALMLCLPVVAAQAASTAEICRKHYAHDAQLQLQCARQAIDGQAAPGGEVATPAPAANAAPGFLPALSTAATPATLPGMISPMENLSVIFGFYDRRFPGFNGGVEHLGVDFTAQGGAPVFAICDGTVVATNTHYAETPSAYLVIDHQCPEPLGRVYAYYGHVSSDAARGDIVPAGATIGAVREWPGNGHLHLGLSRRLVEENWGTHPRGITQRDLEEQGWLNPLDYFAAAPRVVPAPVRVAPVRPAASRRAPALKRVAPQAPVHRQHRPRNVAGQRRR